MTDHETRISIIVPMLNEALNLRALFDRLFPVLDEIGEPYEVLAVDDGSTDDTRALLHAEANVRPGLRVISLARNFGQHAAVLAGFDAARGEWIITLDADLQNPPEEIHKLVQAFRQGCDLVNTYRNGRQDTFFRRAASKITNKLMRRFSGIHLRDFGCMLRGYHREVVAAMCRRKEFRTFIPALAMLYARKPIEVPVGHAERKKGASNYSLLKLFSLQLDLITSFSIVPLRLLFMLGWVIAAAGLGFGLLLIILRLVHGPEWAAQGVFTLFAILFFFVGAQFTAFGLLGEYIGRIYVEVRERPTYLVRKNDQSETARTSEDAADENPGEKS